MPKESNIIHVEFHPSLKVAKQNSSMLNTKKEDEPIMSNSSYLTQKEEKQTDLKLSNLEAKIEAGNDLLSQKLDTMEKNIPDQLKILLLEKDVRDKQTATETRRYLVGTVLIGVIGIGISLWSIFG